MPVATPPSRGNRTGRDSGGWNEPPQHDEYASANDPHEPSLGKISITFTITGEAEATAAVSDMVETWRRTRHSANTQSLESEMHEDDGNRQQISITLTQLNDDTHHFFQVAEEMLDMLKVTLKQSQERHPASPTPTMEGSIRFKGFTNKSGVGEVF